MRRPSTTLVLTPEAREVAQSLDNTSLYVSELICAHERRWRRAVDEALEFVTLSMLTSLLADFRKGRKVHICQEPISILSTEIDLGNTIVLQELARGPIHWSDETMKTLMPDETPKEHLYLKAFVEGHENIEGGAVWSHGEWVWTFTRNEEMVVKEFVQNEREALATVEHMLRMELGIA